MFIAKIYEIYEIVLIPEYAETVAKSVPENPSTSTRHRSQGLNIILHCILRKD